MLLLLFVGVFFFFPSKNHVLILIMDFDVKFWVDLEIHMFRFLSLILVGFVCFYLVLNLGFFCVWMNMFVGLCFCVREKIMRSEERKKKKKKRRRRETRNPMKRNGKKKCNQTQKPNVKKKKKWWRIPDKTQREREKKKRRRRTMWKEKEKKKKKKATQTHRTQWKKEKKKRSCGCCSDSGSLSVCLITKIPLETKVMFGNSFCFLFSKTCFWEYK